MDAKDGPKVDYGWPNQLRVGFRLKLGLLLECIKGVKVKIHISIIFRFNGAEKPCLAVFYFIFKMWVPRGL